MHNENVWLVSDSPVMAAVKQIAKSEKDTLTNELSSQFRLKKRNPKVSLYADKRRHDASCMGFIQ